MIPGMKLLYNIFGLNNSIKLNIYFSTRFQLKITIKNVGLCLVQILISADYQI